MDQFYVPNHTGTYCIVVYDELGCADTLCTVFAILDINTHEIGKTNITVSPNPTSGELNIEIVGDYRDMIIEITNLTGQLVARKTTENESLLKMKLDGPAGLYYVRALNNKGEQTVFKVLKR
jgi:hypothetical protein